MSSTDEGRLESRPAKRATEQRWLWRTDRALELTAATSAHLAAQVVRIGSHSRSDGQSGACGADRFGETQVPRR